MPAKSKKELGEYERKRDFGRPSEPARSPSKERSGKEGKPRFVVQEPSAHRLHLDLRLEHEGVAASWAIPNGIPETPEENRKAVHTEDHPLEYLSWETQCRYFSRRATRDRGAKGGDPLFVVVARLARELEISLDPFAQEVLETDDRRGSEALSS